MERRSGDAPPSFIDGRPVIGNGSSVFLTWLVRIFDDEIAHEKKLRMKKELFERDNTQKAPGNRKIPFDRWLENIQHEMFAFMKTAGNRIVVQIGRAHV